MRKQSKLLEYNVSGKITDADFLRMSEQCSQEIASAEEELEGLRESANAQEAFGEKLTLIRNTLKRAAASASKSLIDKNFVDTYIDKIFVTPVDETSASLEIKIFTGETSSKSLDKANLRTGHTFKKICPARKSMLIRNSRNAFGHVKIYKVGTYISV